LKLLLQLVATGAASNRGDIATLTLADAEALAALPNIQVAGRNEMVE
jgi:hypothetical protein